jgi:hypothetical protein
MSKGLMFGVAAALALSACAKAPESDQLAQAAMIGLSKKHILACLGAPANRRAVAQATEIWTYPGVTATDTPPWGAGLDFATLRGSEICEVRLVMTNGQVSQVSYGLPGGRGLFSGRQCVFAVEPCAEIGAAR